jgi:hypothetical protein
MDTEYVLDGAFELADITALEYAVLSQAAGAYWEVRRAVDSNQRTGADFLQNTARNFLDNKASLPERYFFALCALPNLGFSLKAFAEYARHVVQTKVQSDLGVTGAPALLFPVLAVTSPERSLAQLVMQEEDVGEGMVCRILDETCSSMAQRWSQDLALMEEACQWGIADEGAAFLAMSQPQNREAFRLEDWFLRMAKETQRKAIKTARDANITMAEKARAAIKKATHLFQTLGQEKNLKLFVSGGAVELAHPQSHFKFVVKPSEVSGWLINKTAVARSHTPYELSLFTKDDVFLAKLCVYFKDTPVLDQLLALTMFIQSGDELTLLSTANWFATDNWTPEKTSLVLQAYPQLEHAVPRPHSPEWDERKGGGLRLLEAAGRQERHWAPYRGRVEQWIGTWMAPATDCATKIHARSQGIQQQMVDIDRVNRELLNPRLNRDVPALAC